MESRFRQLGPLPIGGVDTTIGIFPSFGLAIAKGEGFILD